MPTQEEIQKSIEESRAKYKQMRQKQKIKTDADKAYLKFAHENDMSLAMMDTRSIALGVVQDGNLFRYSFAFKSEKDDYNERVAKRLIAKRIITKDPVFYREFVIHKTDCDEFVANYIFADAKALLMALADQDLLPKHITKFVIEYL